jgi:hypothetical protein
MYPLRVRRLVCPASTWTSRSDPPTVENLPGRVGNEGPSSAVTRAAHEAEVPVPTLEHIHDRLRGGRQRPFGADHEATRHRAGPAGGAR